MRKHASMFSYPSRGCFCRQPTTRVLLRISRFSRSRMLFVRILRQCWLGNSRCVSVSPILLDLAVHLLVQVADRRGACAGAPQELGDVLHAAHGYACQVHLDERLLHGRFPAPVALYDGCLERGQAQFRDGDVESSTVPRMSVFRSSLSPASSILVAATP